MGKERGKMMVCEKLCAKISQRQCLINYERALGFDENEYLRAGDQRPWWGVYGVCGYVHPLTKACVGCQTGKRLHRLNRKKKKGVAA